MLGGFLEGAEHIYICCGNTDFRKQTEGLSALVTGKFKLDPYAPTCVFLFCNKRRNALKALRYESDGFILASKKLMNGMKYQWPRNPEEVKDVTSKQAMWLYEGLELEPKKAHKPVKIKVENTCY
jgi:transposase